MTVARADQRNQNKAAGALMLGNGRLQLGRNLGHGRDLDEIEIIKQADPEDARQMWTKRSHCAQ